MNHTDVDRISAILHQLELNRCQALMAEDRERLGQILHQDLIHVHAKGRVDSYESYMASGAFGLNYLRVERFDDLSVRVLGNVALMTGRQLLEAVRRNTGERVRIDSQAIQVWALDEDGWRQLAFQSTPTEMTVEPAR